MSLFLNLLLLPGICFLRVSCLLLLYWHFVGLAYLLLTNHSVFNSELPSLSTLVYLICYLFILLFLLDFETIFCEMSLWEMSYIPGASALLTQLLKNCGTQKLSTTSSEFLYLQLPVYNKATNCSVSCMLFLVLSSPQKKYRFLRERVIPVDSLTTQKWGLQWNLKRYSFIWLIYSVGACYWMQQASHVFWLTGIFMEIPSWLRSLLSKSQHWFIFIWLIILKKVTNSRFSHSTKQICL